MTRERYLALLAPGGDRPAIDAAAADAARRLPLEAVLRSDDLVLLATAGTHHARIGDSGCVVGRAIGGATRHFGYSIGTGRHAARRFVSSVWGDYVAFFREPGVAAINVVRAPAGGVPAYRARLGTLILLGSDVEDLLALVGRPGPIDWAFVAGHLAFPHLRTAATGLAGVDELFAGDCTVFERDTAERIGIWSPWDFATPANQVADRGEARALVRDAVDRAVAGLRAPFASVLLELSGGLDSSVLAAALAAGEGKATALNLVTPTSEGDERDYARATAAACGLTLSERRLGPDVDLTTPVHRRTARPAIPAILGPADRLFAEAGRAAGADAFVSGTGGDCIFCAPASAAPAADALRSCGFGGDFVRAVRDVAEVHDTNLWTAGTMAWRQAHRRPIHRIWPNTDIFLASARLPPVPAFHPWLDEPPDALPGRRSHIRSVVAAFAHLDGYARHDVAPSLFPLLSQPVMEACFRVPTWRWVDGGRDRAIARQAYRGRLPAKILDRRTKGGMDAYCVRNFEANRVRLGPFLLEGHLAGAGLLDRSAVAAFLRQPVGRRDDRFYRLLPIIDVEAWLRGWLGDAR